MLTLSAVSHVYDSLTTNAQRIFCLIIEYYLDKEKEVEAERETRKKRALERRKKKSRSKRRKKNDSGNEGSENEHAGAPLESDEDAGDPSPEPVSLSFSNFYKICREEYLANSDTALKALLTEFEDHDIVKLSKSSDGSTSIRLRIGLDVAKTFLEKVNE